jgi:hypothetical protein
MDREFWYRFAVRSYGGHHASSLVDTQWFRRHANAKAEIKRRLGVSRLYWRPRALRDDDQEIKQIGLPADTMPGWSWRIFNVTDYSAVPASHRDYQRSGGVTLYSFMCDSHAIHELGE